MSKIQEAIFKALEGSDYDRGKLEEIQAECRMLKVFVARLTYALITAGIELDIDNLVQGIRYNDGEFKE